MKVIKEFDGINVSLSFSEDELIILIGGLRESLESLDEWEFSTRTGAEKKEYSELMSKLLKLLPSQS